MDARTRFLVSAAHTYASTAPATAAHLGVYCNELFVTVEAGKHAQQMKGACLSCGSILIPGLSSRITVIRPKAEIPRHELISPAMSTSRKERNDSRSGKLPKLLRNECTKCGRYTETVLPKLEHTKASVKRKGNPAAIQVPGSRGTTSIIAGDKRPRSRRKGGLKALLAEAKETAIPPTSLDLMDFMKSA
ncbi:hypothetical protein MMC27_002809 [Xylographa pallens]|nr:hypothetical protein [Xylographa pallens]